MVREVRINYDPAEEIDSEKHEAWKNVVDKYHALSIGHEREYMRNTSTLFFKKDLDLIRLEKELEPIQILSFI